MRKRALTRDFVLQLRCGWPNLVLLWTGAVSTLMRRAFPSVQVLLETVQKKHVPTRLANIIAQQFGCETLVPHLNLRAVFMFSDVPQNLGV